MQTGLPALLMGLIAATALARGRKGRRRRIRVRSGIGVILFRIGMFSYPGVARGTSCKPSEARVSGPPCDTLTLGRFGLAASHLAGEDHVDPDAFNVREVGETAGVAQEVGFAGAGQRRLDCRLAYVGQAMGTPPVGHRNPSGMADTAENKRALGRSRGWVVYS